MILRYLFFLLCLFVFTNLHSEEWWLEGDYLLWQTKPAPVSVPLVTSASLSDPVPGALGQPGTKILLGDKSTNGNWHNGWRLTLGKWICSCPLGIEGSFFMLPKKSHHKSINTSGEPGSLNVAVPIFDVTGLWGLNGVPGETVIILPGPLVGPGFEGRFSLKISNKLQGFELNSLIPLTRCGFQMDFIGGFRWLQLEESLLFLGKTAALPDAPIASGFYNFKDSFKTTNNFYGPQIGLKANYNINKWNLKGFAKIALGCMNQKLKIKGRSQTSNGNLFYETKNTANEILFGGIFAQPTNRGTHRWNEFATAFESGISLSYQFTNCSELVLGYNFLWCNQSLRPGKQIDRRINPTRTALAEASRTTVGVGPVTPIPFGESTAASLPIGSERPKLKHHMTDFWVQGLSINFNLKF